MVVTKHFATHGKKYRRRLIKYILNPDKTDDLKLVSDFGMSNYLDFPSHAEMVEMYNVNFTNNDKLYESRNDRQEKHQQTIHAHHLIQSFSPEDNLTPEEINRIGYETMMELTGGRFRFIVATHTDKDHIHNHILINAIDRNSDKKLIWNYAIERNFRMISDRDNYSFKTIYDASTMVTSSRQINFWGQKAGASEAVLAREIPSAELFKMPEILEIPAEVLVYGASVIHHSKRPLLQNYYNFTQIDDEKSRQRDLFLAEPSDPESHYSIFEDNHGTHIFANNDLDLMTKLTELVEHGFTHWKLEGLYTPGQNFVEIAKLFIQARNLIQEGNFTHDQAFLLDEEVRKLHPKNRFLDTGFYDYDPDMVK